ncbi:unnamed protein product [Somion occarium]|uniref:Uncharacterized protein n=1 Tax=Somion occarium TaxID=3059160 RepID=A0ABP1E271_9APHY
MLLEYELFPRRCQLLYQHPSSLDYSMRLGHRISCCTLPSHCRRESRLSPPLSSTSTFYSVTHFCLIFSTVSLSLSPSLILPLVLVLRPVMDNSKNLQVRIQNANTMSNSCPALACFSPRT